MSTQIQELAKVQNVSFPRSGNSLLTLMLFKYFNGDPSGPPVDGVPPAERYRSVVRYGSMVYCEASGHCRQWPCPDPSTNFQKHHDKALTHRPIAGYSYLVQYRHPLESLISYYYWTLERRPEDFPETGDTRSNWLAFLGPTDRVGRPRRLAYWQGFVHKWVQAQDVQPRLTIPYEQLVMRPRDVLSRVVRFMDGNACIDVQLVNDAVESLNVQKRRDIRRFRFYDREFFDVLETLVATELDALALPRLAR